MGVVLHIIADERRLRPLRVLLVEDCPSDAELVLAQLRRGGRSVELERVDTAAAMRAALQEQTWDVVISDWSMPTFSGPAALALLAETKLELPFIIVSGTVGEENAVEAMRAGAHDYVPKDKLARLPAAIEREIRDCHAREAHRKAEAARRETEQRMHLIATSGLIGLVVADREGVFVEANDAFLDLVGYSREELEARLITRTLLTPADWREVDDAAIARLRSDGAREMREKEYVCKDGQRVRVLVGGAMLDDGRGIGVVVDITQRRRAEEARLSLEAQLRQAQKMEAVGRLAGGIAHDFNNLLSVILSYGEMLIADLHEGDPIREDLAEIHKAALRAAELTKQLLMFSRQQVIEPRVLDLGEVLSGMEKMLRRVVGEDIELAWAARATGRVRADAGSIEQVVMNLAVNARDAMPNGGKMTIETADVELDEEYASLHLGAKAGRYVALSISDTGAGMDAATKAHIFEPFFTTKGSGKGTGLGLSTVFGIVDQSGGNVRVRSELGVGTSFDVYLPRVDDVADEARSPPGPAMLRGTETILLVEDEEQVRNAARGILRRHGYTVLEARSGEEGVGLCEAHDGPIHLLLTDVVMPHMSGPMLATRIRSLRPEIRVLCMSGYTDDASLRHGLGDTELTYLQKPITVETLTRKVREVLDAAPEVPRSKGRPG